MNGPMEGGIPPGNPTVGYSINPQSAVLKAWHLDMVR
jgi:hypothetical protein